MRLPNRCHRLGVGFGDSKESALCALCALYASADRSSRSVLRQLSPTSMALIRRSGGNVTLRLGGLAVTRGRCATIWRARCSRRRLSGKGPNLQNAIAGVEAASHILGIQLDVCALADLVPLDDVVRVHFLAGDGVDPPLFNAMAGLLIE